MAAVGFYSGLSRERPLTLLHNLGSGRAGMCLLDGSPQPAIPQKLFSLTCNPPVFFQQGILSRANSGLGRGESGGSVFARGRLMRHVQIFPAGDELVIEPFVKSTHLFPFSSWKVYSQRMSY